MPEGRPSPETAPAAAAAPSPGSPRHCSPPPPPRPAAQPQPAPLGHFPRQPARLPAEERRTHPAAGPRTPHRGGGSSRRAAWCRPPLREAPAAAPTQAAGTRSTPAQHPEQPPVASPGAEVRGSGGGGGSQSRGGRLGPRARGQNAPPPRSPRLSVRPPPSSPPDPAHIHSELRSAPLLSLRASPRLGALLQCL